MPSKSLIDFNRLSYSPQVTWQKSIKPSNRSKRRYKSSTILQNKNERPSDKKPPKNTMNEEPPEKTETTEASERREKRRRSQSSIRRRRKSDKRNNLRSLTFQDYNHYHHDSIRYMYYSSFLLSKLTPILSQKCKWRDTG